MRFKHLPQHQGFTRHHLLCGTLSLQPPASPLLWDPLPPTPSGGSMTPIGSCTLVCVLWFTQNRVVGSPEIPPGKEAPAAEKTFLSLLLPTWWGTYYRSRVKSRQISKGKKMGHVNAWPPNAYEHFLVICPVSGLEAGLVPGLFQVCSVSIGPGP